MPESVDEYRMLSTDLPKPIRSSILDSFFLTGSVLGGGGAAVTSLLTALDSGRLVAVDLAGCKQTLDCNMPYKVQNNSENIISTIC